MWSNTFVVKINSHFTNINMPFIVRENIVYNL
jgi:hypothetical protein